MFIELTNKKSEKTLVNLNLVEVVLTVGEPQEGEENVNAVLTLSNGDFLKVEETYEVIKQRIKNLGK